MGKQKAPANRDQVVALFCFRWSGRKPDRLVAIPPRLCDPFLKRLVERRVVERFHVNFPDPIMGRPFLEEDIGKPGQKENRDVGRNLAETLGEDQSGELRHHLIGYDRVKIVGVFREMLQGFLGIIE